MDNTLYMYAFWCILSIWRELRYRGFSAKGASTRGFRDKKPRMSRKSALSAKARTGTRREENRTPKPRVSRGIPRMTEQTKRFIAVSDIRALRFRCSHDSCEAELILPFKIESLRGEVLTKCPSCGREWAVEHKSGAEGKGKDSRPHFKALVEAMDAISAAPIKFSFSLEITPSNDKRTDAPPVK